MGQSVNTLETAVAGPSAMTERTAPRRVSTMAEGMAGSAILKIAGEVRTFMSQGRRICNLTVGDFDPKQFPSRPCFAMAWNTPCALARPTTRLAMASRHSERQFGVTAASGSGSTIPSRGPWLCAAPAPRSTPRIARWSIPAIASCIRCLAGTTPTTASWSARGMCRSPGCDDRIPADASHARAIGTRRPHARRQLAAQSHRHGLG